MACQCIFICCVFLVLLVSSGQSSTIPGITDTTYTSTDQMSTAAKTQVMSTFGTNDTADKCHFEAMDNKVRDQLSEALKGSTKLVKFTIRFANSSSGTNPEFYPDDILVSSAVSIFRPRQWTRSTHRQGQTLLMLDNNFEVLSLSLLGIGIESMDVVVVDRPQGCVTGLVTEDRVRALRQLLLNDFKVTEDGGNLGKDERICNQRIDSVNSKASFLYECCRYDPDGQMICEDIEKDVWITVLLISILIIKILVALYSPCFLPETYYRKKYTDVDYVHHFPEGRTKKTIRIVKTMNPEYYQCENPPVSMTDLQGLESLKSSVECMHTDEIHNFTLGRIHFIVKSRKLLSEQYVPVSVIRMINDNFFLCKIRKIPALRPCCDSGLCEVMNHGFKVVTWFSCIKIFARLLLIGIIATPWFIRLTVYFQYEAEIVEEMTTAAKRVNAGLPFKGSFTRYLTPVHPVYILMYVVVAIMALVYGFMGTDMRTQLRLTLRKCLRDMREHSRTDVYGWAIGWLFLPFTRLGLLGLLVVPLYWPFFLIILIPVFAFSTFPALNLSLRLIVHPFGLICQRCMLGRLQLSKTPNIKETFGKRKIGKETFFKLKDDLTKKDICLQSCVIIGCLLSFWSLTFLLMECLSFFVEVAIYTLMGIIVNAGATLRYVTLFFLVWVYAKGALLGVHKLYLGYHQIIRNQLISGKKDEMLKIAKQNDFIQESTAFRVQSSFNAADISSGVELVVKNGILFWKTSGLLVFLNCKDKPFTPLKFFFETIDLDVYGAPGPLWKNTLAAFYSLMKMVTFLFFVVAVVLAFGNQFSSTNQLLAILAGGFLPFAFRNFLMRGPGASSVSTSSLRFITEFDKLVAKYSQNWPVDDIIPEQVQSSRTRSTSKERGPKPEEAPKRSSTEASTTVDIPDEPGDSNDVVLDLDTEVDIIDLSVDLIVHVSSAEKMSHLVKTCVNADDKRTSVDPIHLRTSAAFSNPMYAQ